MSRRLDEFGPTTDIVLITFTDQENLVDYRKTNALAYPILTDADRSVYASYGLERGSFFRIWGWRALKRYWDILRKSSFSRLESATDDTRQLGGDFVIGPDGSLVWGFWGEGPDDRPTVENLLDVVTSIDSSS